MSETPSPLVSVIIPTHNRANTLRRCLAALAAQDFHGQFEVIVVLDGCVDDSVRAVQEASDRLPIRAIEQEQRGAGAARNRGAAEARAETLLFIDDDITLEPGAVRGHADAQEDRGPGIGIGRIETRATRRGLPTRSVAFWKAIQRRHESGLPPTFLDVFTGNLSVPRRAFLEVGGFNEQLVRSEDIELGFRLVQCGLPAIYVGEAKARQDFTKTTEQVLRDAEGYGRANVALWIMHPGMRRMLHMGGVTSGIGLRARVLPVLAGWPLPMAPFRLLGAIPHQIPGTGILATWAQTYWRVRGVRAAAGDEATWRQMTARLRILRYDRFDGGGPSDPQSTSQSEFGAHMRTLKTMDVDVVGLGEYVARLCSGAPPERDSVVVTLDAQLDVLEQLAFPVLAEEGLHATAFLRAADFDAELPGGIERGIQGGPGDVATALSVCADRSATAFAYGPGVPSAQDRTFVSRAGFDVACTQRRGIIGWRTDPHLLPRVTVPPGSGANDVRWLVRYGAPRPSLSRLLFKRFGGK